MPRKKKSKKQDEEVAETVSEEEVTKKQDDKLEKRVNAVCKKLAKDIKEGHYEDSHGCLLYTSPSPRD